MFVEAIEAVSTGVGVIEISQEIFPTFTKIFNWLRQGQIRIVVFGAGGTGKTTLGKLLSGKFKLEGLFPPYQESIEIEEYRLDGNAVGAVIVAPGQERREHTWDDLFRSLADGKVNLLIHVVSWGYHSFGEYSYTQHRLYQSGMTLEEFIEEYAQDRRTRELNVLSSLEPHLSIAKGINRAIMITLVTKQDLWWNNRLNVKNYYVNGDYNEGIQNIMNKRGAANFVHEYCSTSLFMENLISGTNELLVQTTQGYDQRLKIANYRRFINNIEKLLRIELNISE